MTGTHTNTSALFGCYVKPLVPVEVVTALCCYEPLPALQLKTDPHIRAHTRAHIRVQMTHF